MSIKAFFCSDAGKAVAGLSMASLLFVWPPAAGWLMACLFLAFAISKLEAAFRRLEREEAELNRRQRLTDPLSETSLSRGHDETQTDTAGRVAVHGARRRPPAL